MNSLSPSIKSHAREGAHLRFGGLLVVLALAFVLALGAPRAHAGPPPQLTTHFPALTLTYTDVHGPGAATFAPQGLDAATGGTVLAVTIAQSRDVYTGAGFARQVDSHGYVIAATVTGSSGESYFLAGTLSRGDDGARWRGHGRSQPVGSPGVAGAWHLADWPVVEPPRPLPTVRIQLQPAGDSSVSGVVTLAALLEGETRYELELAGLESGAAYGVLLHAGNLDLPSASVNLVTTVTADAAGRANASGLVRFRGTEDIPLTILADGHHVITVVGTGQPVAVGAIPAR
ncbi:MAG: hypothetical protein HY329_09515 [Chloroflexi bacterium]|nr:hypothetical protein [Chloroflexota bacterium]